MKTETAVITGAYGFIGRSVARLYGEKGWKVVGMGHGVWPRAEWSEWKISEWHTCDITIDSLLSYGGEPDVIVHCAGSGSVGFSLSHPFQDYERTVNTTAHVLEFARLHAPGARIVYPSSAGVYGMTAKLPINEESVLRPVSPYGMHKKMAEELCSSYGRHFGVASAVVRLFSVYGKELRKQLLWDSCSKLSRNETTFFGTGRETRDLLHIRDAAELLFLAGEHASRESPVVNGGSGTRTMIRDIVTEIFSCFQRNDHPVFTGTTREGDPEHYEADIARALSWGWKTKIERAAGINEYVTWFREGAR
jgi:UDP-glucose 4-epimerase